MPLGKLSKNHLMQGYKVLSEIQELIKQDGAPKAKFVGTSHFVCSSNTFNLIVPQMLQTGFTR